MPQTLVDGRAGLLDRDQRVKPGDGRPFVVDCAAPEDFSVLYLAAPRIVLPIAAGRNHIDMTKHAN